MWEDWFAWHPVRLLTMQWVWLRTVHRRPAQAHPWNFGGYDYAWK